MNRYRKLAAKVRRRGRRRTRRGRRHRGGFTKALLKLGIAAALLWGGVGLGYYAWALTFDLQQLHELPQRSLVIDCHGEVYSRMAGENRIVVPFDRVANDFVNALISREDSRFYLHPGIDPIGIARAAVSNLLAGRFQQGASTITQQLARNSFPLGGRNLHRKAIEAALAFRIETELSKEEILEAYMNRIYFGSGNWGVETASQAYFGKPARKLTLGESAMLAGLIRSPNRLSPHSNLEASLRNRDVVLERMRRLELISEEELRVASRSRPEIAPPRPLHYREDWVMSAVAEELQRILPPDTAEQGGLRIETTIDPRLQRLAEKAVLDGAARIERMPGYAHPRKGDTGAGGASGASPYVQAALIALDNRNGGIRAIVGGRDFRESRFNRARDARRQAGSAVKPFIFAAAFARGLDPESRIKDAPLAATELPRQHADYRPANADGKYSGPQPARIGLQESRNTMSVRVLLKAGIDPTARLLEKLGLTGQAPRLPSLALGAFETTLESLTAAYTVFPTNGVVLEPYLIERVVDSTGHVLYSADPRQMRVFEPAVCETTTRILASVITRGTAAQAHSLGLRKVAAGKTGTTDDFRDAWFVGFITTVTCGVWVGMDQPEPIMPGGYASKVALPIWVDFMQGVPSESYPGRVH